MTSGDAWMKDQTVHDLVLRFAGRRTSLPEAEKGLPNLLSERRRKGSRRRNSCSPAFSLRSVAERDDVMAGIERFSQRQQQLREQISAEAVRTCGPSQDSSQIEESRRPRTSFQGSDCLGDPCLR